MTSALTLGIVSGGGKETISANTTKTIKASGGDFATIDDALTYARSVDILPPYLLTLQMDPGEWPITSFISIEGKQSIVLTGASVDNVTVTSIVSSGGSAGNFSVVLQLSSWPANGIAVNNIIQIYQSTGNASAGLIRGGWRITAIDQGNTRITIALTTSAAVSGGAAITSGNARIIRTVISTASNISMLLANSKHSRESISLKDIGLWSSSTGTGAAVLNLTNCDLKIEGSLAVVGGVTCSVGNSTISANSPTSYLSVCGKGLSNRLGINVTQNSKIVVTYLMVSGNTDDGISINYNSSIYANQISCSGNTNIGIRAQLCSFVTSSGTHVCQNNTNGLSSPAANTTGNQGSFISSTTSF